VVQSLFPGPPAPSGRIQIEVLLTCVVARNQILEFVHPCWAVFVPVEEHSIAFIHPHFLQTRFAISPIAMMRGNFFLTHSSTAQSRAEDERQSTLECDTITILIYGHSSTLRQPVHLRPPKLDRLVYPPPPPPPHPPLIF